MNEAAISARGPFVSVVTPFYNTEKYLADCIKSVLNQTHENFEYVLLDNCSNDGSSDIAAQFARCDARIRLHRNDSFLDQIDNYNRALELIDRRAKYVKYVQADDFLFPQCIEEMVRVAEGRPTIGVVSSLAVEGRLIVNAGLEYPSEFLTGRETCRRALLDDAHPFGSPTSVLFRADLARARRPFYLRTSPFEDSEACFELMEQADFGFVHQVLSFNRRDPDSFWARMSPLNPSLLFRYLCVIRFGPRYLTETEFRLLVTSVERSYYRFLGSMALRRPGSRFWEFHGDVCRELGRPLRGGRIAAAAAVLLLDALVHPLVTFRRLSERRQVKVGETL